MVRPPLVGQASSSSSESRQSLSSGTEDIQEERNISPFSRSTCERFPEPILNDGDYFIDNPNCQLSRYLSNREDYISAKPPEGSSDHSLVSVNTAEPSSDSNIRISSPASSVTSVRPLEWDSGADVGYQQHYLDNVQRSDPVLSTIERLAIGTTALLTRSDPEGTTEPSTKPVAKTVVKVKNITKETDTAGLPKAQSTPFNTFMPSNENVMGNRDMFSPIAQLNNQMSSTEQQYPNNEESPTSPNYSKKSENKYSLFPELKNCKDRKTHDSKYTENLPNVKDDRTNFHEPLDYRVKNSVSKSSSLRSSASSSLVNSPRKSSNSLGKPSQSIISALVDKDLVSWKYLRNNECNFGNSNKKLSSSLEDVRDLDNLAIGCIVQRNTLPRSQSQSNILSDKDEAVCSNGKIKDLSTNMVIHSFPFTTNKSASSSSVATVVQKKNDSPLHYPKLVHTSLLKQSIGIQACEQQNQSFDPKPASRDSVSKVIKSNYFIQKVNADHSQSDNNKENIEIHLEQCHKGFPCKGAHKKVSTDNDSYEVLDRMNSHVKPNQSASVFPVSENSKYQESTLDSVESSCKSRGFSSIAAEDRVNSFEYLPGYVYENEKQISSRSTSSVSVARKNASENIESLWETDDSINLTRDINRGVEIIKDVVRNRNDNEMKKKVIQLVVEKLINTNYAEDDLKGANINGNVPWVPPILEKRNDNTFKRQEKSKVPGELSSLTDASRGTSNTSSECFKPKPPGILRDIGTSKLQFIDKCIGTGDSLTSTSRKGRTSWQTTTSIDSTDAVEPQAPSKAKIMSSNVIKEKKEYMLGSTSTGSLKYDKKNWMDPVTKAEQIYEQRRKLRKDKAKGSTDNNKVIQFFDLEKKTQLMRIDIEMQHLNNLQKLLSRTEELKENMKDLKKSRSRILKQSRDESDAKHSSKSQTHPSTSVYHRKAPVSPSKRKSASRQYKPNMFSWMNKAESVSAKAQETKSGWSSHHYFSEDPESVMSKREVKSQLSNYELKIGTDEQKMASASPALKTRKIKQSRLIQTESPMKSNKTADVPMCKEDCIVSSNILRRRNLQNDLIHSVGVQSSNIVDKKTSDDDDKVNKCGCHNVCGCCKENRCCKKEKDNKQRVGYYITFQPEPSSNQREIPPLEEVRIRIPSEPSKENITKREKETCSSSESDDALLQFHKPTLQDYLEGNRPNYIHRANDRRQCIAQLAYLRELRDQSKRRLLALSEPTVPKELPPPPLAVKRVFSQKKMRQQTERKYRQLAEVQTKQQDTKRKEAYRTNRLMADVFTKKLQRRVLKGEVNLSNSVSIISSL